MISKKARAQEYLRLYEQEQKAELVLDRIQEQLDELYLEPFRTMGIHCNASCILRGLLKNPKNVYRFSTNLLNVKNDGGMCFSDDTMYNHISRIFKHFKETGLLVKVKGGYKLNSSLKEWSEK